MGSVTSIGKFSSYCIGLTGAKVYGRIVGPAFAVEISGQRHNFNYLPCKNDAQLIFLERNTTKTIRTFDLRHISETFIEELEFKIYLSYK